jgi:FkbM family methyltransferase
LEDGTQVACIVRSEALVLDQHVAGYFRHGISLRDEGTIIDVGANVGVFGVRVLQQTSQARLVALEPVPPIHDMLARNLEQFGAGRAEALCYGAARQAGSFELTYFPRAPAMSTAHPERWTEHPDELRKAVAGTLRNAQGRLRVARLLPAACSGWVARWLTAVAEPWTCALRPLGELIDAHVEGVISLLKVDCEGAELETLQSIWPEQWSRIAQVVVEVHDEEGRLDTVCALLTQHGLTEQVVDTEEGLEETHLRNVYAHRSPASSS